MTPTPGTHPPDQARLARRYVHVERSGDGGGAPLTFRIARESWEFDQIHRLNYQTFVNEIPQHEPNADGVLVDAFHHQNTYVIAVRGRRVVGMLAVRGDRPFSLDRKLPDLDRYLPAHRTVCEVRLLATAPDSRHGVVFYGLLGELVRYARSRGFDLAVISGTLRQEKLYRHLGFAPFGPVVGSGDAPYQPMYLTLEALRGGGKATKAVVEAAGMQRDPPANFLPGPVTVAAAVREAFARPAVSHRSAAFMRDFHATRRALCALANARDVQILMGSGTVANDAVAAALTEGGGAGVILSNGAFGDRLVDHATRFGLRFRVHRAQWGAAFDREALARALDAQPRADWMWVVHGETSTGVLNDLALLKSLAGERRIRLCVDAVSSLGAAPVDLAGVSFASSVSGKALGALSGLAFVFHDSPPGRSSGALPRYLDLAYYASKDGMPFTVSSNLVDALRAALEGHAGEARFARIRDLSARLRAGLCALGYPPLAHESAFAAVTTIPLHAPERASDVGERLEDGGYLVSYRSEYLLERNWIQACLMGECDETMVDGLLGALRRIREPRPAAN